MGSRSADATLQIELKKDVSRWPVQDLRVQSCYIMYLVDCKTSKNGLLLPAVANVVYDGVR